MLLKKCLEIEKINNKLSYKLANLSNNLTIKFILSLFLKELKLIDVYKWFFYLHKKLMNTRVRIIF